MKNKQKTNKKQITDIKNTKNTQTTNKLQTKTKQIATKKKKNK